MSRTGSYVENNVKNKLSPYEFYIPFEKIVCGGFSTFVGKDVCVVLVAKRWFLVTGDRSRTISFSTVRTVLNDVSLLTGVSPRTRVETVRIET